MAYHISNIARSKGDPKVLHSGPSSLGAADRMAKALGWFSIGLGLTELIARGAHHPGAWHGGQGEPSCAPMASARLGHGIVSLSTGQAPRIVEPRRRRRARHRHPA